MNNIPEDVVKMIAKVTALKYPDNEETGMKQPNAWVDHLSCEIRTVKTDTPS